jgi:hypothetical protein
MLIPSKHNGYRAGIRLYPGGKGGDMQAPDPALIAAQIKSMGIQDDAIQRIMANSESLAPLQKEQMQWGLDSAKTAYNQSQEDRDWLIGRRGVLEVAQNDLAKQADRYGGRMYGEAEDMLNEAKAFSSEARQAQLAGEAGADAAQAFGVQRGTAARELARAGVNPADGRFASMQNQMAMAEAGAKAGSMSRARQMARQEGLAMRSNALNALNGAGTGAFNMKSSAANMLAGYPAMGLQSSGQGAQMAAGGLNLANAGLQGLNSGFSTGAGIAGQMGQNATSMWGQQANAYNQSQANAGEGFGAILGAGAKLGAAYMGMPSDRRLKTNISQVGVDERTGLALYEFEYIGGSGQRYEGVMADEVERVMPEAVFEMPDGYKAVNYQMLGIEMKEVA